MSNDPRNRFERAATKQAKQDPATKEMPLSQRLDRLRGKKAVDETEPDPRWRPSRPEDRSIEQTSAFTRTKAPTTYGGVTETPDLTSARQAEQARRKALETQATGRVQRDEIIPENATAIMIGWITRNAITSGGTFFYCEWNVAQLTKCVDWQIRSGQPGFDIWGISQITAAHQFLLANGYYETERHHRGQEAPKSFPQWAAPQSTPEPVRSGNKSVFIRQDPQAVADARKMTFEEVQAAARSQFKPDNR